MNKSDVKRNLLMLKGSFANKGYDWWWHSFTAYNKLTKEEKPFFIEYFIINPKEENKIPVLGQIPANQRNGIRPSYVMIKAGCWGEDARQIHNFYPISELNCNSKKLDISVKDCLLCETALKGHVSLSQQEANNHPEYMSDAGILIWDLKVDKQIAFNVGYGASSFFRKIKAFEMFWHAEGIKAEYSGTITLDNDEYEVIPEKSYGYADKNWGSDFTSPWIWIASSNITSKITGEKLDNTAFDMGGGKPKILGIPINKKLLGQLTYKGNDYEFNFSKFWKWSKVKFKCFETQDQIIWEVKTKNRAVELDINITCQKKHMLLINYEAPNGKKLHNRLWNGGNGVGTIKMYRRKQGRRVLEDELELRNVGCEYGEYAEI